MTLHTRSHKPDRPARLSAEDWIETALATLVEDGIDAVQITALSRRLDVTRGSFYWHFESREALLNALIDEWRARNTGVMLEAIRGVPTLDDGILALFAVWVDHNRFDPKLDQAVRDWARHDVELLKTVKAEDAARTDAIAGLFERHGYEHPEAFIRARVIYFTQISFYALKVEEDEDVTERLSYLDAYFRCFTGRDFAPDVAEAHRAKYLSKDIEP